MIAFSGINGPVMFQGTKFTGFAGTMFIYLFMSGSTDTGGPIQSYETSGKEIISLCPSLESYLLLFC